jgi:hypothetical protein
VVNVGVNAGLLATNGDEWGVYSLDGVGGEVNGVAVAVADNRSAGARSVCGRAQSNSVPWLRDRGGVSGVEREG